MKRGLQVRSFSSRGLRRGIFLLFVLLAFTGIVNAGFGVGNPAEGIGAKYAATDLIKGWINISLNSENSDSLFEDNFGNSISLISLLKVNPNSQYSCLPSDCKNDYSYSNPQASKTLSMEKNQEKILGFLFTGNNFESLSSFSLRVSSNAQEDSSKQLLIDILNDDSAEWQSYKPSNNFDNENYGCFANATEESLIFNQVYCEKMNIPVSPKVEIGAYVIKNPDIPGNATLVFSIEGNSSEIVGSCEVTASATGRISCIPSAKIDMNQDYFVCVKAKSSSSDENKFKVESETSNPCGYASTQENKRDFRIFSKPGRFAAVGEFQLNSSESQKSGGNSNLENYIKNYVIGRYGTNCSNGCVVPFRVVSQASNHGITLSNISIFYVSEGTPKEEKNIYDLSEIPAVASSGFQKLNFDSANFSVSGEQNENKTYSLELNGNEIFEKIISFTQGVEIISLVPKTVVAGFPTKFTLTVKNPANASPVRYEWNFGNNDTQTTSESQVTYTYNSIGTFQMTVKAMIQNNSATSKTFIVNAKTPKEAVNSLLKEKLSDLGNLNAKLDSLPEFQKSELKRVLETGKIEGDIASLQQRNSTAQTDSDYVKIMAELVSVNVPKSVFESGRADLVPFSTNAESINLDVLKEIDSSGAGYEQSEAELYGDAIVSWNIENVNSKISFYEFSAQYEDASSAVLRTFRIDIDENPNRGNFYFVIKSLQDMEFMDNYGQREILGYEYIKLDNQGQAIEFSTTEEVGFSEIPVFMTPEFRDLSVVSPGDIASVEDKSKKILVLVVLFVAVLGFAIYIALQEWYKRRYEDYLFKNKNNLLNIVSYIQSSMKKGVKNEDIEKGLRKSGWSSEQITYVMKKYAGERTGMFEIPLDKIRKLFSRGNEDTFRAGGKKGDSQETKK